MLRVEVLRGAGGMVYGFDARGHAGFARHGQDIVCAGASAVLHTAALGVVQHLGLKPEVLDASEGRLALRLSPGSVNEPARAVLEAAVLGVREIARQYPEHVQLIDPGAEARVARTPGSA